MRINGLEAYFSEVALFSQVAAYSTDVGCSLASPAISRAQKTALNSAGSLSKHPGEPMQEHDYPDDSAGYETDEAGTFEGVTP